MAASANGIKQKWNQAHYTQVKVSVPHDLAKAFKDICLAEDVSMASEISCFMRDKTSSICQNKLPPEPYKTRPKRRKAVLAIIEQLENIMQAEMRYLDNIPDNLRASIRFEEAEQTVSCLDDAVNFLSQAY